MSAPVLMLGDCLERMAEIPAGSVDAVISDLPYQTTQNRWDVLIPFEPLWAAYRRVLKPNGAIVLTASQPFTTALIASNMDAFKYAWVWDKNQVTNFLNAKKQPLRRHEDVVVFYDKQPTYNPQMTDGAPYSVKRRHATDNYGAQRDNATENTGERHPDGFIRIPQVRVKDGHPTQKPVALMEYLVKTYTNIGDTVLDNCAGSFTTGVACVNTDRRFIGIERDPEYFRIGCARVEEAIKRREAETEAFLAELVS